jgi:hypothetical protein
MLDRGKRFEQLLLERMNAAKRKRATRKGNANCQSMVDFMLLDHCTAQALIDRAKAFIKQRCHRNVDRVISRRSWAADAAGNGEMNRGIKVARGHSESVADADRQMR